MLLSPSFVFLSIGFIGRLLFFFSEIKQRFFPVDTETQFAQYQNGAFEYSDLIKQHAITAVIPFLPLQEVHVRQCIGDAARRMAVEVNEEMEEFVLNELDWEPERSRIFSTSGCKLVYDKVGFYLQQSLFANEKGVIAQPSEHGEL
uniref:Torsin-like protein n=1 Tax=Mesocestoides corti TaxID=53468 RepID=A0A5K3FAG9_MESCO